MGVVYRARDEVLNRDVALKLLARGALDKVGSGHLLREAQTASSLSHPNICTIHQVHSDGAVTVLGGTFSLLVATFQRPPSSFEAKNELFRVRKAMAEA
jgi:serine/threonine protein kinase